MDIKKRFIFILMAMISKHDGITVGKAGEIINEASQLSEEELYKAESESDGNLDCIASDFMDYIRDIKEDKLSWMN